MLADIQMSNYIEISHETIAEVAYSGASNDLRISGLNYSEDFIAVQGFCVPGTSLVTSALRAAGNNAYSEVHALRGPSDLHCLSVVPTDIDPDDDIIVDAFYKQHLRKNVRADMPNVYIGPRRDMVDLIAQFAVEGELARLYQPHTLVGVTDSELALRQLVSMVISRPWKSL